jgi:hypothetical protein
MNNASTTDAANIKPSADIIVALTFHAPLLLHIPPCALTYRLKNIFSAFLIVKRTFKDWRWVSCD